MKYKATILQEVTQKEYSALFDSIQERDEYVQRTVSKPVLGLGERFIKSEDLPVELQGRVIRTEMREETYSEYQDNPNHDPENPESEAQIEVQIIEQVEYSLVKSDFKVELSEEDDWAERRASAYSNLDSMLMEAIAEKEAGRPEKMTEYLSLRDQIKLDNPKPQ